MSVPFSFCLLSPVVLAIETVLGFVGVVAGVWRRVSAGAAAMQWEEAVLVPALYRAHLPFSSCFFLIVGFAFFIPLDELLLLVGCWISTCSGRSLPGIIAG